MAGLNLLTPSGGYVNLSPTNTATNVSLNLPAANGSLISANTGSGAFTTSNFNSASSFGYKNRIINGGMVIDQRNAGASVTNSGGDAKYIVDRWYAYSSSGSKFTAQQNAGSVTPPVGYTNYIGVTSSSSYSPGSTELSVIAQWIEGYNMSDFDFGLSSAKTFTISFWVRSSLTGTFHGYLTNNAQDRRYIYTYTISSANTWEQKFVTITGDITGTWLKTNGGGMQVGFSLAAGSAQVVTPGSWLGSSSGFVSSSYTNVLGTNGATWYVTGIQVELGSQGTSFDFRSYGQEMLMCQRYYQYDTNFGQAYVHFLPACFAASSYGYAVKMFPVEMRSTPSVTFSAGNTFLTDGATSITPTSLVAPGYSNNKSFRITMNCSGGTAGQGFMLAAAGSGTALITYSAEI